MSSPVNVERYLELTKIEEIASEMIKKGYNISKDHKIANLSYDLFAEKNGEKIFIEVKSGKALQNYREQIKQMASTAKKIENAAFKLVVVNPPRTKSIEIENIENILYECFIENLPNELDQLSTHTLVDDISDVEITDIRINSEGIVVSGEGLVVVNLQYGSRSDQEAENDSYYETFPFEFKVLLSLELNLLECKSLSVDTSSFYE